MIGYLKGALVRATGDMVVIDTGGVGYLVSVPVSAREKLGGAGSTVELHVHTQVREDQLALFGFPTPEELELFQMLIQVDGVGPKVGLAILNAAGLDVLKRAILAEEVAPIRRASGVGPRTAQKVVIDLKPKLEQERELLASSPPSASDGQGRVAAEVETMLRGLGFGPVEARRGVAAVDWASAESAQAALAAALRSLGKDR